MTIDSFNYSSSEKWRHCATTSILSSYGRRDSFRRKLLQHSGVNERVVLNAVKFKACHFENNFSRFPRVRAIRIYEIIPVPFGADANTKFVMRRI